MERHKKDLLYEKISPLNIKTISNVDDLLKNLKKCGFQGRNIGMALDILHEMVINKDIITVLSLSGAMIPAGMGDLIRCLIEYELIDVLVTTGANIIHDLVDVFNNGGHYIGNKNADDNVLFKHRINRIYDVFLPEDNYISTEKKIFKAIQQIYKTKSVKIKPSDFLRDLGEYIKEKCILSVATNKEIPIFIPAFSDSELALDLIVFAVKENYDFQFDILGDVQKYGNIIKKYNKSGSFIIGGGTPRNWSQQIFPLLDQISPIQNFGFDYSVRVHTAVEYDGGLSGCTISESKSWGKYSLAAKNVSVWCDATIALPLLIIGLFQRLNLI